MAEAYLSGRLAEALREEYERHFFECDRCADELDALQALRGVVAEAEPQPATRPASSSWRFRWAWGLAAAATLVTAVGITLWLRNPALLPSPELPRQPVADTGAPAPPAPPSSPDWEAIAAIRPAPYRETVLRGGRDAADKAFREGMRFYTKGEFAQAIPPLRSAERGNTTDAGAPFFLGIALLIDRRTSESIEALRTCVARGDSPYLEEAHLYMARAFLREGDPTAAHSELERVIALQGDREAEARELLERIRDVQK
jgi:tetratricopeptide (TPR) repeat protein